MWAGVGADMYSQFSITAWTGKFMQAVLYSIGCLLFNAFFQIPAETSHVGFAEKIVFFSHLQYLLSVVLGHGSAL